MAAKMREVDVPLSKEDFWIVLGVRLMYWGVPFHRTKKQRLSSQKDAAGPSTDGHSQNTLGFDVAFGGEEVKTCSILTRIGSVSHGRIVFGRFEA